MSCKLCFSSVFLKYKFFALLFHYQTVMSVTRKLYRIAKPIIYGFALAYLISPVIDWVEESFVHVAFPKLTDPGRRESFAQRP